MTTSLEKSPEPKAPDPQTPASSGPSRWVEMGRSVLTAVLSVFTAILIGGLLIAATDQDVRDASSYVFARPQDMFAEAWRAVSEAYLWLFRGAFYDPTQAETTRGALTPISETLVYATPVILTGLAVALAFRTGMFNIGAQGQMIMGAALAGFIGFHYDLPPGIHVALAVVGGALGGALYGAVAGILKATTGAHEVIVTIMLNFIALRFLGFLLSTEGFQAPPYTERKSLTVADDARLPHLFGFLAEGLRASWGVLIALAAALAVWWVLERSTLGFRLRAVGENPDAARTAGISAGWAYIAAMTGAGMLAGLAGAAQVLGTSSYITSTIDNGAGFDGITAALLGRGKPAGVIAAGLLFGALRSGGQRMSAMTGTPVDIVVVVQALTVLFIAAPALIQGLYRVRTSSGLGQTTGGKGLA